MWHNSLYTGMLCLITLFSRSLLPDFHMYLWPQLLKQTFVLVFNDCYEKSTSATMPSIVLAMEMNGL